MYIQDVCNESACRMSGGRRMFYKIFCVHGIKVYKIVNVLRNENVINCYLLVSALECGGNYIHHLL
jgi:hypothetical protein